MQHQEFGNNFVPTPKPRLGGKRPKPGRTSDSTRIAKPWGNQSSLHPIRKYPRRPQCRDGLIQSFDLRQSSPQDNNFWVKDIDHACQPSSQLIFVSLQGRQAFRTFTNCTLIDSLGGAILSGSFEVSTLQPRPGKKGFQTPSQRRTYAF